MKKFLCVCMAVFVSTSMLVCASAVVIEKEQYTIDLPDHFDEIEESKFIGDNNQTLAVNIDENTSETICVADMSQRDVEKYMSELTETTKAAFASLGREGTAEVLDADAFDAFAETGDIFNQEVAEKFRKYVLTPGGIDDGMVMYKNFRGREPKIDALLKNRGF